MTLDNKDIELIKKAAFDLRFLLDREYKKTSSIEFVGNRYQLIKKHRDILKRAIYSKKTSEQRKNKFQSHLKIKSKDLYVDGFNTLILIENALSNNIIFRCSDGAVRDIAGISNKYKRGICFNKSIDLLKNYFNTFKPKKIIFVLDHEIPKSKETGEIIKKLVNYNIFELKVIKNADNYLSNRDNVISSDSLIMDNSTSIFDAIGYIIDELLNIKLLTFL